MSELLAKGVMTKDGVAKIDYESLANLPVIDSELSESSTNAIQNTVVAKVINEIIGENTEQGSKLVEIYTHTKTGNIHNFEGSGSNGKALINGSFSSGDHFSINGVQIDDELVRCGADFPDDDIIIDGQWVTFVYDGERLDFVGGGGSGKLKVFEEGSRVGKAVLTIEDGILVIREA